MRSSEKYIDLLMDILAIPSFSRNEQARSDFLEHWINDQGLSIQRIGHNLIVTSDGALKNKKILLNSHIDTVSPTKDWITDPLIPVRQNGRITALGSNDAGASVVALLAAFSELTERSLTSEVVLVLSAEEEVSGKNGITSVLPLLENIQFALVGEPTGMQPAVAERGLLVIDALAKGRSGHAARNEGINSIYIAMEDIQKIKDLEFHKQSVWLPDPSVSVTMINAGTQHNVVPGECSFVIDVRSNDMYSNEEIYKLLLDCSDSVLTPRSFRLKSSVLPPDHAAFQVIEQMSLVPFASLTLSDMSLLPFSAIKMGPGESDRSHTAEEFILESELEGAGITYAQFISGLLKTII